MNAVPASRQTSAFAVCMSLALAGCGHHGSEAAGDSAGADEQTQSIGGIWNGTDASGRNVVALADEAGEFHVILDDGTQYSGTASTMGDAVSANAERLQRHSGPGGPSDAASAGSEVATALKGKVQQRQSMSINVAPASGARSFPPETFSLQFNSSYNDPSSLAMVAGDYMDSINGNTITVAGSGTLFWRDSTNGCLATGAVSIIDARYDLYEVQFSYSACTGALADLNGMEFLGLGTLDTSTQRPQLIVGVTGEMGGHGYAIDLSLSKLPPRSPI
jgi:hypothetical protein